MQKDIEYLIALVREDYRLTHGARPLALFDEDHGELFAETTLGRALRGEAPEDELAAARERARAQGDTEAVAWALEQPSRTPSYAEVIKGHRQATDRGEVAIWAGEHADKIMQLVIRQHVDNQKLQALLSDKDAEVSAARADHARLLRKLATVIVAEEQEG